MDRFEHLLKGFFEPLLIHEISETGKIVEVKEGTVILQMGQAVKTIPILLKGSIKIMREDEEGRELLLYYLKPGESCAMTLTCCMQQYPSEVRAITEDDSEMITLPIMVMDDWLTKYPSWKNYVMTTVKNKFNELLKALDQLAFQHLDERLVHYLKQRSKIARSTLVNLSHEQIANDLATSRVVISRLLKKLEEDKKILLYRQQIKLLRKL